MIGVVVLAAGRGSRFGGPKQCVELAGVPMVRRTTGTAIQCGRVVVVTGAYRARVEACLSGLDVEFAFNRDWLDGMGASIACGTAALLHADPDVRACVILLADQPLVTVADLAALVNAHRRQPVCIIASCYGNKTRGAPCLFPRRHFDALMRLEGPGGARPILRRHNDTVIAVRNPRAGMDMDTPADLHQWTRLAGMSRAWWDSR